MPTIHLLIKGKVQGVFYRASAREQAQRLSITGWVKNTPNGDVEITATGDKTALDTFIAWCRRGPNQAMVTGIDQHTLPETNFNAFDIIRG
jgi:acylphosphatase